MPKIWRMLHRFFRDLVPRPEPTHRLVTRRAAQAVLAAALACATASPAWAQRALTQYQLEAWNRKQGMPGAVGAITQTRDGYLWAATEEGLVRFDGARLTTFTTRSTPALASADLTSLAAAPDGALWIGTIGAGVARYDSGGFRHIGTAEGLPDDVVHALHLDGTGTLWVGTVSGLSRVRDGRAEVAYAELRGKPVRALAAARHGGIWVGTERHGIFEVRAGAVSVPPAALPLEHESIRALLHDSTGLWIGTARGLFRLREGRLDNVGTKYGLAGQEVRELLRDGEGSLWITTTGRGLARLRGEEIEFLTAAGGLPGDAVNEVFVDRERNVWVGTVGFGMAVLRPGIITPITPREGLSGPIVLPIIEARDGAMWIGTFGNGLNRLQGGRTLSYGSDVLGSDFVLSLLETPDSTLWIGTRNGLRYRRAGAFREFRVDGQPIRGAVLALLHSPRSGLWIGTSSGLVHVRDGVTQRYTTATGLAGDFIYALFEDRSGTLWIGSNGGGIARWKNGFIEGYTRRQGLASDVVFAFYQDAAGVVWVTTNAGITRVKDGQLRTIDARHGLPDDKLFWIRDDRRGHMWMTGNAGLFRIRRAALDSVADGLASTLAVETFGEADGAPSSEMNGAFQPSGWQDRAGRFWLPTMSGAAVIHPDSVAPATAPSFPVLVQSVIVDDRELRPSRDTVRVPAGARRAEFQYAGLSFRNPAAMSFEYRLDGYDPDWIPARQSRTAVYTGIPPGSYVFRVRARNATGGWSTQQAAVPMVFAPYFHQTAGFRIGVAVALALVIVGGDRLRAHAHRRRERALLAVVEERRRAEARYRDLFELANDIVLTADREGRLTSMNRRGRELLGVRDEHIGTMTLADLAAPASRAELASWIRVADDRDQEGSAPRQVTLQGTDGKTIPAEGTVTPVREQGVPVGIQAIVRDVSEREAMAARMRESHKLEAVGSLAAGIAHDFNNLLAVIMGTAALLRQELGARYATHKSLDTIESASARAAALVRQLLAFSRRQLLVPEIVNVNTVVREASEMLRRVIPENIPMVTTLADDPWPVSVDPGQLHQVVMNLAINARDAMPDGGTLTIATRHQVVTEPAGQLAPGEYVCLEVRDTGTGMDAATRARVFEPFFTTKGPGKGTGLGLATVYGIVTQSGGSIDIASAPGKGTAITVCFPRATQAASVAGEARAEEHTSAHAPASAVVAAPTPAPEQPVLIVEDDDQLRAMLSRVLERAGHRVLTAPDGQAALTQIERHPDIALVLTDMVMPVMGGLALYERLQAERRPVRVIFMSGYSRDEEAVRLRAADATFLAKPMSVESVTAAVKAALAS